MKRLSLKEITEEYYKNPNHCKQCGKVIDITLKRKPTYAKRMKFCSRSCAATFNNSKYQKRFKEEERYCFCGELKNKKSITCHKCKKPLIVDRQYNTPIKNFICKGNARVKYATIRKLAKQFIILWGLPLVCEYCGYDKHVEICHIKPISEFDENEKIIHVNGPNNLICLCPNHHWELDNGKFNIIDIR